MEEKSKKSVEEMQSSGGDAPAPVGMDTCTDTSIEAKKRAAAAGPNAQLALPDDRNGPYHERHRFSQRLRRKLASAPKPQPGVSTGSSGSDDDDGSGAHQARPDDKNGPYHERHRFSQRLRRKLASAPKPQPGVSTGSSGSDDDVEDGRPTGVDVEAGRPTPVTPAVQPPTTSTMSKKTLTPTKLAEPSVPILHAHLVEDESERPVYDAVPVEEEHWAKRHQRKIVGGLVMVIVALAVVLGVFFGADGGGGDVAKAETVYGSQCFADREELKAAVDEYTAGGDTCVRGGSKCEVIQTYGWPIGSWCTSNITDMSELFEDKRTFNDDLPSWDTSKVTSMERMFFGASAFNGDVSNFNTSKVTTMARMFAGASSFNGDVGNWDTSRVTDMASMFDDAFAFNGDLSSWDTSKVTSMEDMFQRARSFNGDVSNFDTSKVTLMAQMFEKASSFIRDVSKWDTSKVTSMEDMFFGASAFNGDVSRWDISNVTSMRAMFAHASSFSQNLCAWGVQYNDTSMEGMVKDTDMFWKTKCTNQNDPTGPDTNWCSATCAIAE